MFGRDGGSIRIGGCWVLELARFSGAECESVCVTCFGAEDVEAPRLCEAVIRRERGGRCGA